MSRYYIDFPNGQRITVKRLSEAVPYCAKFGTPMRAVQKKKSGFTDPVFYNVKDGRAVRTEHDEQNS